MTYELNVFVYWFEVFLPFIKKKKLELIKLLCGC